MISRRQLAAWLGLLFLLISRPAVAQQYEATWESLDSRPIPAWFNEAKFGIFIHWGVYSVPAYRPLSDRLYASYAEWYYARVLDDHENGGHEFHVANYGEDFEYRDFAPLFRAELFDPDLWADLFKRSGARYVVLTSKHHDGFSLWPTKSPFKRGWNSGDTGPRRDLVGDLGDAVRRAGLRYGLYYSIIEWESTWTHRTDTGYYIDLDLVEKYRIPEDRYVEEHLLPQLKELVTQYQPALIFSDAGEWDGSEEYWQTKEFLAWLYNEAPNRDEVVVNDRWANGMPGAHGDYYSSEYADAEVGPDHPWEESRGIGGSYGFNRAENIDDYSTSAELIIELIDIASRGGNLLLNVGPTADGRIPVIMQQRLLDIGAWLEVNGEAIYGSTSWTREGSRPADEEGDGKSLYFTAKNEDLFLITTRWPAGELYIDGITAGDVTAVSMLGVSGQLDWAPRRNGISIRPPDITPADLPCEHAWVIKIKGALRRNAP
ncbi:alpha-L-fucosidase [Gemmatimonadota bacterium]